MQSCWVNYLQFRFGWSATLAGSTLAIVGLIVALLPSMIMLFILSFLSFPRARVVKSAFVCYKCVNNSPLVGVERAIQSCLLLHAVSMAMLGSISVGSAVFLAMPFFAAGACSMPMLLGYLTQQVIFY